MPRILDESFFNFLHHIFTLSLSHAKHVWNIFDLVGRSDRSFRCPGERAGAEDKKGREQPPYCHPSFSPQKDAGGEGPPG
jgi:hypothetical protein